MKGNKLIDDRVQISVNLVKLKTHGITFETAIDPDKAVAYKEGEAVDIQEIVHSDHIFVDMKKGLQASELELNEAFNSTDMNHIVKVMLDRGEIQFTQKYRQELRDRKKRKIISTIHRNAIDPKSGLPHPVTRIEAAMEEANVKINDLKKAEDQIANIIKALRPIIPIAIETVIMDIHIPPQYAAKLRGSIAGYGKLVSENWLNDGSLLVKVELPAGLQNEIMDDLNGKSHGACEVKHIERK